AVRLDPADPWFHLNLASSLLTADDVAGALAECEEGLRQSPASPLDALWIRLIGRAGLASILDALGRHRDAKTARDDAIAAGRRLVVQQIDDPFTHAFLAEALNDSGDREAAVVEYRAAVAALQFPVAWI